MALIFNTFKTLINEYIDGKKGLTVITVKVAVNKALNPQSTPNTSKRARKFNVRRWSGWLDRLKSCVTKY